MALSDDELERYARHIVLRELGGPGQQKLKAAKELKSGALRAEAKETLACSYLSFALLLGLAANALLGWWWADPVAALLMVPWLFKEGREGIKGECCECDACGGEEE